MAAERDGDVFTSLIPTHGRKAISEALQGVLDASAVVMTDGLPAYKHLGKDRAHLAVNHSQREYVRTDEETGHRVHVNRVEAFNGFLGRGPSSASFTSSHRSTWAATRARPRFAGTGRRPLASTVWFR